MKSARHDAFIHEDTNGDGDVDGDDAWRRLVYDHRWRVVAERQDAETRQV